MDGILFLRTSLTFRDEECAQRVLARYKKGSNGHNGRFGLEAVKTDYFALFENPRQNGLPKTNKTLVFLSCDSDV
jgi:hypothetical protein